MRPTLQGATQRRGRPGVAALAAVLVLAACGGGDSGSSSGGDEGGNAEGGGGEVADGGTLRVAHPVPPSSLDPVAGNSGSDHIYLYPMFDTLIDFTPDSMEPAPGLATEWNYPDPETLELTLEEDVTFHDGTPFNAQAVKYNLERSMEWDGSNIAGDLASVESVEVVDPANVVLHLNRADTSLPLILSDRAGMMVSPDAAEEAGDEFGQNPVGAGPFEFEEWLSGERVAVNQHGDYWGEAPTLDSIDFSIITDPDTQLNAVMSGEQDFTFRVEPGDLDRVETTEGVEADTSSNLYHYEFYLNLGRPPFDDPRVREAFNLAIDREEFLAATQAGEGEIAWGPLPSTHWAFDEDQVPSYEHDPERARELLAEAGYEDGLTFEVVGWTEDVDIRRAEVIQAQLEEAGMTMEIRAAEVPQATAQFMDEKRYDAYLAAWTGRPDPSLTYRLLFSQDGYFNTASVETPGVEDLLQQAQVDDDLDARAEAFAELNELVIDESLYVPLAFPPDLAVFSSDVVNYTPNLLGKPKLSHVGLAE